MVAGRFVSPDLERAAGRLLESRGVVRLPHLPAAQFLLAALACDACINLRYPAAGETSDVAVQLMGAGKTVVLTDSLENAGFPESACLRVEPGLRERESLYGHLVLLTSFPGLPREIGARAAAHIAGHHALSRVAGLYWSTLCAMRG
jgi:hypothetical protein